MGVTTLICVIAGTAIAIVGLYLTGRSYSLSARERAIKDARAPLEREIAELRSDISDLKIENRDLRKRCNHLEDELRQKR